MKKGIKNLMGRILLLAKVGDIETISSICEEILKTEDKNLLHHIKKQ